MNYNILCLSHLAWERTLFQRPQQLMLRLAGRGHQVVYAGCVGIKAAMRRGSAGVAESVSGAPALQFLHLPCAPTARSASALRTWYAKGQLGGPLRSFRDRRTILWLYHPALLGLGRALFPDAPVVYDVMDRFTAFAASQDTVVRQEAQTLASASIVFTGGRSIDRSISAILEGLNFSPPSHCLPSGIDLVHFGKALDPSLPRPADLARLPRPVFGYFGAVDERMDFPLLGALAAANPQASVVLVGPLLGPAPAGLPANVHLLGGRPYDDLPAYVRGFDVCLLPFRNTALVASISPTKTPEYLAGGRPVVSTPIPDVVSDYGDVVRTAGTREAFLAACRELAENPPPPEELASQARRRAMTWDQIAQRMDDLVAAAVAR